MAHELLICLLKAYPATICTLRNAGYNKYETLKGLSMKFKVAGKIRLAATLLALGSVLPLGIAQGVTINVGLEDATNGGNFFANLTLEDTATDTVEVASLGDACNSGRVDDPAGDAAFHNEVVEAIGRWLWHVRLRKSDVMT